MPKGIYRHPRRTLADRFWPKVDRRGPEECWPWRAYRKPGGYGAIAAGGRTRPLQAHRVAWILTNGPIAAGLHVCHRCDNPPCVNPAHLFLGTDADNAADAASKGRVRRGERHPHARLTAARVRWIRAQVAAGVLPRVVARRVGVTARHVRKVADRRAWRALP
jgi:hypothetical protein